MCTKKLVYNNGSDKIYTKIIIKLHVFGLTFIYTLFCSRNINDECGTI